MVEEQLTPERRLPRYPIDRALKIFRLIAST